MSQGDFLDRLIRRLDEAGISYMVSGSLGSSYHGEPRATNDVDLVILPSPDELRAFVASLGDDYYVSSDSAEEALRNRSMFNVIDFATGWKADLIIRKERPFSVEEFRRRRPVRLLGIEVFIVAPEDAILSKLEWAKLGSSERQQRDALGIATVQWTDLDRAYLQKWAKELDVEDLLDKILLNADEMQHRPDEP